MELTVMSSQGQSGITTQLWKKHPEQTTEPEQDRSRITSDRQKNKLWHNLSVKEYGGDLRGLAGHSQVAALEG